MDLVSACLHEVSQVTRVTEDGVVIVPEVVAREIPVDVFINGTHYLSISLSPQDIEDYAFGMAFSAGLIESSDDIANVEYSAESNPIELRITLKDAVELNQNGMSVEKPTIRLVEPTQLLSPEAIWRVSESLVSLQTIYQATGATHAAVFADLNGEAMIIREDVGRHVVVDKLIGALIRGGVNPSHGFVFLSSRCALELVTKCARYGTSIIATVSAPTSAVIDFAEYEGVTLCAFSRGRRFTIYTHPERLLLA